MSDKLDSLTKKRDKNKIYAKAKKEIKHINHILQEREHLKEKLHSSRNEGGVDGSIFEDSFYKRADIIKKRKISWMKYTEDIDREIEDLKSLMKVHTVNYIDSWYEGLTPIKLFLMRFIA